MDLQQEILNELRAIRQLLSPRFVIKPGNTNDAPEPQPASDETWRYEQSQQLGDKLWYIRRGNTWIASVGTEPDAQRIAAVPELIDALKEASECKQRMPCYTCARSRNAALLKAGVEPKAGGE